MNGILVVLVIFASVISVFGKGVHSNRIDNFHGKVHTEHHLSPGVAPPGSTTVTLYLNLLSLVNVDLENGNVDLVLYERMTWTDPRLSALAKEVDSVRHDRVWRPDVVMYNDLNSEPRYNHDLPLALMPEGKVSSVTPFTRKVPCKSSGEGELICELNLGSWVHSVDKIRPTIGDPAVDSSLFQHPKYKVASATGKIVTKYPQYPMAVFSITLNKNDD